MLHQSAERRATLQSRRKCRRKSWNITLHIMFRFITANHFYRLRRFALSSDYVLINRHENRAHFVGIVPIADTGVQVPCSADYCGNPTRLSSSWKRGFS